MAGDWEERLEQLYRREAGSLWRSLVAYAGDPEIASDAVAEAFAQALRRGEGIREPQRWVWKVAFRVTAGELKERAHRSSAVTEGSYEMPEDVFVITGLLGRLPRRQRAVIVLHYYADLPTRAIADTLGMSAATVRVHLSQGRRRLRELLEETSDG